MRDCFRMAPVKDTHPASISRSDPQRRLYFPFFDLVKNLNSITFPTFLLIMLLSLWLLTGIIFLLHRYSTIMGLFPLTAVIGGLTAMMQFQILGVFYPELEGISTVILVGNYLLLPVILVSLLIVYITNGSIQARVIVDGIMTIVVLVIVIGPAKLYFPLAENLPVFSVIEISARFLFAQALSLMIAIITMFVGYQFISNIRGHFPSRFAVGTALLLGVLTYILVFHLIAYGGNLNWWQNVSVHFATQSIMVLTLWPLLNLYLSKVMSKFPDSVAESPRPALDFFITPEQLESRAQYNYSLLRTISQINQLIFHAGDAKILLQQACNALVELRKYRMVWIGTLEEGASKFSLVVQAGFSEKQVDEYIHQGKMTKFHHAGINGQAVIVNDIKGQKPYQASWQQMMLASGCHGAGTFPMRYGGKVLGFLNVGVNQSNALGKTEIKILEELADDLAYALISLEAQKQQTVLDTATETMQDGLLIADLHGNIIYANTIIAHIVGVEPDWMPGKNINDLFTPDQLKLLPERFKKLDQEGTLIFDLPYQTLDGRVIDISINATIVNDSQGNPIQLVSNIRDITYLREYEHQLLSLNQLTGELVQIYDIDTLMERILGISEDP